MGRLKFACPVLEINLISAQDLASVSRNMKTYSVAWINTDPMRKLTTRVDQNNRANPIWNEKFVFRVNDKILDVDASAIVIEIYAAAWAKDALVGTVNVLLSDLFAPWSGFGDGNDGGGGNNNMRLVTLQIRRPSGRLHGFLRLGVALLDGGQRSMPLSIEVFDGSRRGETNNNSKREHDPSRMMHRRTNSDQTDLTTSTNDYGVKTGVVTGGGARFSGGGGGGGGGGVLVVGADSMVNGSLCNSDIGPSASVVAAAIAQGLYNRQKTAVKAVAANKEDASSILEGKTEGIEHRVERWRAEKKGAVAVEVASSNDSSCKGGAGRRRRRRRRKEKQRRRNGGGESKKGLFSCFGNVFGCEISITCGGGSGGEGDSTKKRYKNNKVVNLSAVDETFSHSAT
ncbi:Protein SRC2 [Cardamine amara subsp. amara]|uniref:Protein SRC2 n=1 Tax=Cardamine amara subsp. amara TaxID=228776 RepID=A0ABD1AZK4_CARAN